MHGTPIQGTLDLSATVGSGSAQAPGPGASAEAEADWHLHIALAQILPSVSADDDDDEQQGAQSPSSPHSPSSPSKIPQRKGGLTKLARLAREASDKGADVIVFPEYFLTGATHREWRAVRTEGWPKVSKKGSLPPGASPGAVDEVEEDEEEEEEEHWLDEVEQIARDADIDIVAGTVVELGTNHDERQGKSGESSKAAGAKPGAARKKEPAPLYNTAYYISRKGEVVSSYTKRNLWHPEREVLTAAAPPRPPNASAYQHPSAASQPEKRTQQRHAAQFPPLRPFPITTKRGRTFQAAMLICWDLAWPEMFREYLLPHPAAAGPDAQAPSSASASTPATATAQHLPPDVFFVPTCWYATDCTPRGLRWNVHAEQVLLDALVVARAIESEAVVAMCNVAGPSSTQDGETAARAEGGQPQAVQGEKKKQEEEDEQLGVGRSAIAAPFLGAIARVEHPGETLLLGSVDMRMLQDARKVYKVREDLLEMRGQW